MGRVAVEGIRDRLSSFDRPNDMVGDDYNRESNEWREYGAGAVTASLACIR